MQQLQDFLNECIEKGWRLHGKDDIHRIEIDEYGFIVYGDDGGCPLEMSMHDLFSVESGLMEFVNWKDQDSYVFHDGEDFSKERYGYFKMCTLTAEKKIEYFLDATLLPDHPGNK